MFKKANKVRHNKTFIYSGWTTKRGGGGVKPPVPFRRSKIVRGEKMKIKRIVVAFSDV